MTIRESTSDDIEEIISVDIYSYKDQFGDEVSKQEMEYELAGRQAGYEDLRRGKDRALVVSENEQIVGYSQFVNNQDGSLQIRRIYILPEFQNKGLGRELINSILNITDSPKIYIEAWKDNYRAIKLYSGIGFTPTGRRIPYVNHNGELDGYEIEMILERAIKAD